MLERNDERMEKPLFAVSLFTACQKHYTEREGDLRTRFILYGLSLLKPEHSKVSPLCNRMPLRPRQQELIACSKERWVSDL